MPTSMTPEEHLLRWLVTLKHKDAVHAVQALSKCGALSVARLVAEAQHHTNDPHFKPALTTIVESMLGNGD